MITLRPPVRSQSWEQSGELGWPNSLRTVLFSFIRGPDKTRIFFFFFSQTLHKQETMFTAIHQGGKKQNETRILQKQTFVSIINACETDPPPIV